LHFVFGGSDWLDKAKSEVDVYVEGKLIRGFCSYELPLSSGKNPVGFLLGSPLTFSVLVEQSGRGSSLFKCNAFVSARMHSGNYVEEQVVNEFTFDSKDFDLAGIQIFYL
jgi:hypothetical protein